MKVLVVYYTESGQTEKIANVIHEEVSKKYDSDLKKIDNFKMKSITDYDLMFPPYGRKYDEVCFRNEPRFPSGL